MLEIAIFLFAAWILKRTLFTTRAHWTEPTPPTPTFFKPLGDAKLNPNYWKGDDNDD